MAAKTQTNAPRPTNKRFLGNTHTHDNTTIQETEQIWKKEWEQAKEILKQERKHNKNQTAKKLHTYLFRRKIKTQQQK